MSSASNILKAFRLIAYERVFQYAFPPGDENAPDPMQLDARRVARSLVSPGPLKGERQSLRVAKSK